MPELTPNLGLKKPLDNETADIAVINENMDTIDAEIVAAQQTAESAQQTANNHASRHAAGGADPITPEMIGAETPEGAQNKADEAMVAANNYTNVALNEHKNEDASISTKGHVQLSTSISSTSTTTAATSSAVKQAYDLANAAIPKSLATESNQFLVSSGVGTWIKKTITEIKSLLGLKSAAYTESSAYATATQGSKADAALPRSGGNITGEINMADNLLTRPYIKDYAEVRVASTSVSGTKTLDISQGNIFDLTLAGNTTLVFSNPSASGRACSITVIIRMPSTLYSVTFPSSVKWSGDEIPEFTVSKTAILTFVTINGGSRWYGMSAGTEFTT